MVFDIEVPSHAFYIPRLLHDIVEKCVKGLQINKNEIPILLWQFQNPIEKS